MSTVIQREKTVVELVVPKKFALQINKILIASNKRNFGQRWKPYNINICISGYIQHDGEKVFEVERISTNCLPVNVISDFILEISSFDEKTNKDILNTFTGELCHNFSFI
jgi:hypothetical protein